MRKRKRVREKWREHRRRCTYIFMQVSLRTWGLPDEQWCSRDIHLFTYEAFHNMRLEILKMMKDCQFAYGSSGRVLSD